MVDKVLARSEESSFLTKHLRAYGGTGEYEGYKLGRLLKGFYFSGKGLVEKPANPRSIIFSKDVNPFNANATVNFNNFITLRESIMTKALNEISQVEASAKAEVDDMAQSSTEVETQAQATEEQPVAVEPSEAEAKISEVEAKLQELSEKYEKAMQELAEKPVVEAEKHMDEEDEDEKKKKAMKKYEAMKKDEAMKKQKAEELEATIAEKDAKIEAMEKELAELQASVATMSRKALLTQAGISSENAESLLAKFSEASDEMFETVIELAKSQTQPTTEPVFDGEQENEVSASELEEAEDVVEPSLAEAGEEPVEVEMSTASEWLRNSVLKLTKNLK